MRSNFPATEMARREGNFLATDWSNPVRVVEVSIVSFFFFWMKRFVSAIKSVGGEWRMENGEWRMR